MSSIARVQAPYDYAPDEWKRLTRTSRTVMMPELFDDLLAPNLPVDAMRILRYVWFRTWGRVQPNPWMPPQRVSECLPQWALDAAMTGHAYSVYRDLRLKLHDECVASTRSPLSLGEWEPTYRERRRLWAESWAIVESRIDGPKFQRAVARCMAELERGQFYPDLMCVTVTQQNLADAFGPRTVLGLGKRGRTRGSLRSTLRWMETVGLVEMQEQGPWSASNVEFGPEMWHVLKTGDFSPSFRETHGVPSSACAPFFRHRGRGFTPLAEGFNGVRLTLGPHYRVPYALDDLEQYLPQPVMPVVWYVVRNTLGRDPEEHSSLGYVGIATKEMARLYGPASVSNPLARGRRVSTVREAIDWCIEHGVLDRKRRGDWTELSIGPELRHLLCEGELSLRLRLLLSVEHQSTSAGTNEHAQEGDNERLHRLLAEDALPTPDVLRIFARLSAGAVPS